VVSARHLTVCLQTYCFKAAGPADYMVALPCCSSVPVVAPPSSRCTAQRTTAHLLNCSGELQGRAVVKSSRFQLTVFVATLLLRVSASPPPKHRP
jgi:hypothetical protein